MRQRDVTFEKTIYHPGPWRFEAGTPNIADAVGLGAALEYLDPNPVNCGAIGGGVARDYTTLIVTSMLPRVAREYGHTWCAASTSAWAAWRSMPGRLTLRRAARP